MRDRNQKPMTLVIKVVFLQPKSRIFATQKPYSFQVLSHLCRLKRRKKPMRRIRSVSVSAMLVYIHQKNIAQVFILERYFFVSICSAVIPCTYLAVFLVAVLPLCL